MNFDESVKYLYRLGNEVLAMKLGLENISKLLNALGNPQKNYLKVQVAGTNGKGSTCAFLEAICLQAGLKTGMTTSPHLISITERVKINGAEIDKENFARLATEIRQTSEKLVKNGVLDSVPTFFEQITAIALLAFAENKVELGILETGLGGRLDAVTAANAEIVAITPISFDHQRILGETLAEIAAEKAAVIRFPDQKTVVAKQDAEAEKVIVERCAEFGIKPLRTDFDLPEVRLSLKGNHQIENAKVAFRLAEILNIDKNHILAGLQTAVHKGRLEFFRNILFDGSHNVAGAKALRDYLSEEVKQPITLIFGAMKDKDIGAIAEILFPLADVLILTEVGNTRTARLKDLRQLIPERENVFFAGNSREALKIAAQFTKNLTCVTGSLYLVGELQEHLKNPLMHRRSV